MVGRCEDCGKLSLVQIAEWTGIYGGAVRRPLCKRCLWDRLMPLTALLRRFLVYRSAG